LETGFQNETKSNLLYLETGFQNALSKRTRGLTHVILKNIFSEIKLIDT
jgi:hypothetical protein